MAEQTWAGVEKTMKQLLTIIGPNGVGKSTTGKLIVQQRENTAYVDAEWCRFINPFVFTESIKQMVSENIYCLLKNYLCCSEIDTVIFAYGWHGERKEIYDVVIEKLKKEHLDFKENIVVLKCSESENIKRATTDGRDSDRIKRGMEMTFSFYDDFDYPCIDTTNMTPLDVAKTIIGLIP